ncbi:TOBE domain-containing protein [Synechocystis sp. PCC 7509]|uniref:TOBE domain-containing protein n=1 Tax=Synechocystis sp. PCC 7509 TaxID=927677 RepID=UPI0002AD14A8|nr:TOBE domain-containing protein [Synechocystis sp. PCC 7509]
MRQIKLLPGTMLLMLASTLSINPVNAQTSPASGMGETQNPINPSGTNTPPVTTPMQMENPSAPASTPMQNQVVPSSTEPTTTNTVSGTIRSIEGETVTLEMADGMTKQMMVSRADLQSLNLREGMQISATLDAQSMASNITLAQARTTTGTEATTNQVGTTSATESTTSTEVEATSATPTTTTETTQTTVQSTPANRPVRALW